MNETLRYVQKPTWVDVRVGGMVVATIEWDAEGYRVDSALPPAKGGPFRTYGEAVAWIEGIER